MNMPEALRLADEWLRKTRSEADRRNSAYDHYGMGNTPENVDPLGAKMVAELRRLHEANEAFGKRQEWWNEKMFTLEQQRDALLEALLRIESAVDWYLGRSSFTQTTQLKGLKHSANVRKELFAAHDEARAAIKAVEETK